MKKTPFIVLTLVAGLSIGLTSAQAQNNSPSDWYVTETKSSRDTVPDTLSRPPDPYPVYPDYYLNFNYYPSVQYDYYYRSHFFNSIYRRFFPRQYYAAIHRPGFVPNHLRTAEIRLFPRSSIVDCRPGPAQRRVWFIGQVTIKLMCYGTTSDQCSRRLAIKSGAARISLPYAKRRKILG